MSNKVCFIIANKYYRGYESYLSYYINNIHTLYPEALTIVVDNNSKYSEDVFSSLRDLRNVVLLINDCKDGGFELGAYKTGIKYILDNNLVDQYSFYVCTQENFLLKNFFDFKQLLEKQTYALPINSMQNDWYAMDVCQPVLQQLGLFDNLDKVTFCWCSSFIVANKKLEQLYGYLKQIVQTRRHESEAAERYLARILWELNEHKPCGDIDGDCRDLPGKYYDCWSVDLRGEVRSYFAKRVQQRNEHTRDRE